LTAKFEAGAFDEDAQAADLIQEYEARIAALERMVGRQALEIEFLKGALKSAPRPRAARPTRGNVGLGLDNRARLGIHVDLVKNDLVLVAMTSLRIVHHYTSY
jgi:hypothetical protein